MNEITIHGNLTAAPVLRYGQNGRPFCTFAIAVNRSYYSRDAGTRVDQPTVFHNVVAFNNLAENAAKSLAKGATVSVTGYLTDDSYTPDGSDQRIRRTRLEAGDIAASLRFATAAVTKRTAVAEASTEPAAEASAGAVTEPVASDDAAESSADPASVSDELTPSVKRSRRTAAA
jgi:single-strand DNA-binding protein